MMAHQINFERVGLRLQGRTCVEGEVLAREIYEDHAGKVEAKK